ncbi:hypothetical protein FOCG_18156 [Fusarium oxysporum f. sp. radicis-lycopersici 26381]|nr:hypothetical protein FOCG_18156 [Fusarium oxysporum f. sp. radicis-lycopersici 26381]
MSCSSCVGKITAALEQKSWVRSANVALLTQSATVELDGEQNAEELVKIINDLGYEANLEHVDELPPAQTCGRPPTPSEALESFPWTESVDVSLITNSATVVFKDRRHLNKIVEAIENVGYKAKLSDVIDFSKDTAQDGCRTASIRIDGMYCQHCPGRVTEALDRFGERMTIEKSATLGNPIMTVSYTPNSPAFTIRAVGMPGARITTIVNNFTVAMNSKSRAPSCCLDDRQTEHEYKRPTLVAPLDRKSSAHLILAVHPCMRYEPQR